MGEGREIFLTSHKLLIITLYYIIRMRVIDFSFAGFQL